MTSDAGARDHGRLTEREQVTSRCRLPLAGQQPLVLEEHHRVVAADRGCHQADDVGRRGGGSDLQPGMVSAQFSTAWECWAPKPSPPPFAVRITSGTES